MHRQLLGIVVGSLVAVSAALAQEADLLVTKSGPAQAAADSDVAYTVMLQNLGPGPAALLMLDDPLPGGMTFVTATQENGPALSCTTPAPGNPGTVACSTASLPAGVTIELTFVFHISPATPPGTFFTNIATASSATFDPNDENNAGVAVTSTPPPPSSDMLVLKSGPASAGPDTDVVYTLLVTNGGPDTGTNVTISDPLPGDMTFVSLAQDSGPTLACSTPAVGAGGVIECSLASWPAGQSAELTLTAHVPAAAASGTEYLNTVTVTSNFDPNPKNDSSLAITFVSSVDVSVVKSGPPLAAAGSNVAYTLTLANAGPDPANNVQLIDELPPGTAFVALTQDSGPTLSCGTPPFGAGGTVGCSIVQLLPGQQAELTLVLDTGSASSYTNVATASTDSFDTDSADNSSSVATEVTQSADVGVAKSGPASVVAGANVTYALTVTNAGPSHATGVTLTDVLPTGTTFVSLMQTTGSPLFPCATPPVGNAGTVTCGPAALTAGGAVAFDLVLSLSAAATGTLTNVAGVGASTPDPDTSNASAEAAAGIAPGPAPTPTPGPAPQAIPASSGLALGLLALALAAAGLLAMRR